MISKKRPYIVIIDDDVNKSHALIEFLEDQYSKSNVFLYTNPAEGVDFIEKNLDHKIIVLLDIMFNDKPVGFDVFNEISQQSSLICFIIMSGNLEQAPKEQLQNLINGHAWYIIQRDRTAKEILSIIKKAESHMMMRVDGALEEWILRHSTEDQELPYIKTRSGKSYSLKDILHSLRTNEGDEIGQNMASDILMLAIDLLARDKSHIGKQN